MSIDERDLIEESARAARFRRWAEEDGLYEAIDSLRDAYKDQFENSKINDQEGREMVYLALTNLRLIKNQITKVIAGGKMAEIALREIREKADGKPNFNIT